MPLVGTGSNASARAYGFTSAVPEVLGGMVLITPTSIASTGTGNSSSIGANGSVTFSTCVTLSLNGVFTSLYDNYMVTIRLRNDGGNFANLSFRLRANGTDDATASSYIYQRIEVDSTTIAGVRTTGDSTFFANSGTSNRDGAQAFIFGPALAQPTATRTITMTGRDGGRIYDSAFTHNQSTAYDGFSIFPTGGSIEGLISVYGLVGA